MNKRYVLGGVLTLLLANPAYAAFNCATPPSCASLGYDQSVSDCEGKAILRCPFDKNNNNAVWCSQLVCGSGEAVINGACEKVYASCKDAEEMVTKDEFKASNCLLGLVDSVMVYKPNGELMECYPSCCGKAESLACESIAREPEEDGSSSGSSGSSGNSGGDWCLRPDWDCVKRCLAEKGETWDGTYTINTDNERDCYSGCQIQELCYDMHGSNGQLLAGVSLPSFRSIAAAECQDKYVKHLAQLDEDDFEVYIG